MTANILLRETRSQVGLIAWDRMNEEQQRRAMRSVLCAIMLRSNLPGSHWCTIHDDACRLIDARQWSEDAT